MLTDKQKSEAMKASWKCRARPHAIVPEDCNWPFCGCDPHVDKIIDALIECGWRPPEPSSPLPSPEAPSR